MADDLVRVPPDAPRARRSPAACPEVLRDPVWMDALAGDLQAKARRSLVVSEIQKGVTLARAGDAIDGWYGVLCGFLRVEDPAPAGHAPRGGVARGGWFGEDFLLMGSMCDASLVAQVPTLIAWLSASEFTELMDGSPAFARFVSTLQARKTSSLRQRVAWPRRLPTNSRVACSIADLFLAHSHDARPHFLDLTQTALANHLSLSRQRTNVALNAIASAGEIDLAYGGICVHDPHRLLSRGLEGVFDRAGAFRRAQGLPASCVGSMAHRPRPCAEAAPR